MTDPNVLGKLAVQQRHYNESQRRSIMTGKIVYHDGHEATFTLDFYDGGVKVWGPVKYIAPETDPRGAGVDDDELWVQYPAGTIVLVAFDELDMPWIIAPC